MVNRKKLVKQAQQLAQTVDTWADLSNALYNPFDGLLTSAFPAKKDREAFARTDEYKQIREIMGRAIDTHGLLEGADPTKSGRFVVRLPRSLHAALEREAKSEGVSLNQLVVAKLAAQLRNLGKSPMASVLQAFLETRSGYSADRVVADTEMNRRFHNRCRELGATGTDFDLNWMLFNARKNKILANLPKTKKYTISPERTDKFEHASEIAVRAVQRENHDVSLDRIICDPELARAFDEVATRLAPGYSSLEYRWVALGLRKARRLTADVRSVEMPRFDMLGAARSVKPNRIPSSEGVYLFRSTEDAIFVGETDNLHDRIERHFEFGGDEGVPSWLYESNRRSIQLGVAPLPGVAQPQRKAMELKAINELRPLFNFLPPRRTRAA